LTGVAEDNLILCASAAKDPSDVVVVEAKIEVVGKTDGRMGIEIAVAQ
jgi:hypothetical protein